MPVSLKETKTLDVYKFLKDAATNTSFRKKLESASPAQLSAILATYGVKVPAREIPSKDVRRLPSRAECRALIKLYKLDTLYKNSQLEQYDYNSSLFAPLILMIGFAMPLAAVEDEVAAAG